MERDAGVDRSVIKYTPETFKDIWPTIEPWLSLSLDIAPPYWTLQDILKRCENGAYVVWVACLDGKPHGALLAGLEKFETAMVCGVPWGGGLKTSIWMRYAQEIIEIWAKDAGCTFLTSGGRKGWVRVCGFKESCISLFKEL